MRALRGLLGVSAAWAILWIPLGWIAGTVEAILRGRSVVWMPSGAGILLLATVGAVCGLIFGVVFHVAERRRKFAELSFPRIALWGLVAGLVIPGGYAAWNGLGAALTGFVGYGAITMVAAITTLAIARRAVPSTAEDSIRELESAP